MDEVVYRSSRLEVVDRHWASGLIFRSSDFEERRPSILTEFAMSNLTPEADG